MNKKIVSILVMTLLITTTFTVIGTNIEKTKPLSSNFLDINNEIQEDYTIANPNGVVLWDNGMHYFHTSVISQWDPMSSNEAIGADDFQFEETTVISGVQWMSLYNDYHDLDFDWNVSFYIDGGDGMTPGEKIYEEVFPNAVVHETFVEEIEKWGSWMFSYWVDLAEPITFTGGEKYWISIQGIGTPFLQSYWGGHAPVILHELVWKSPYWYIPEWETCSEFIGISRDFCFQLTGDGEPVVPDLECEGELRWDNVLPGTFVNSTIIVINNCDVGSMLRWEVDVDSLPDWGTNWTVNWTIIAYGGGPYIHTNYGYVGSTTPEEIIVEVKAPETKGKYSGEIVLVNSDNSEDTCSISISCTVPRSRTSYNTLLQHLFERFPNAFLILRQLLRYL